MYPPRSGRSLGSLCYRVSFSVMEVLYVLAAVLALAYVVWNIAAVVRARGRRKRRAYSAVLGAVCAGLSVCAATCLLWGVCYYTDTFQDRSGIRAEEVSLPDLTAVTAWFAENLAQTADQVPRDEAGTFNASLRRRSLPGARTSTRARRTCSPSWNLRTERPSGCSSPGS